MSDTSIGIEELPERLPLATAAAPLTLTPRTTAEAAAALRTADQHRASVSIQGSGTKRTWLAGDSAPVRLHTTAMDAVIEHTWQDLTCTVAAGCRWSTLQQALARHGQFVALDPLWPERSTVGGVLGANDSGSLRHRYGSLRDLVLGVTAVLADGTVARSGGKVVKNVAGYDLPKLFCGSFGTLALVSEVTLRLHALPPTAETHTFTSASSTALGGLSHLIRTSHLSAIAMQLRTVDAGGFALDVKLAGLPEVLRAHGTLLHNMAVTAEAISSFAGEDPWSIREQLFARGGIVFKATALPSAIAPMVHRIAALNGRAVAYPLGICFGSLDPAQIPVLLDLRRTAEAGGGSLTLLDDAGTGLERWGTPPSALAVMQAVKRRFDPHGILNPGRYFASV